MYKRGKIIAVFLAAIVLSFPASGITKRSKQSQAKGEMTGEGPAVLWRDPTDIAARNLYYGPGGEKNQPHGPYTFVKEDLDGSNPKFVVRDRDGVKWKVKLGLEARPETVATRLVWAVGYFANEDYFRNLWISMCPRGRRSFMPSLCRSSSAAFDCGGPANRSPDRTPDGWAKCWAASRRARFVTPFAPRDTRRSKWKDTAEWWSTGLSSCRASNPHGAG